MVAAGLRCAPESGAEMYAPVRTAKPHPKGIASHPASNALDRFKRPQATTPQPSRVSTAVPIVSRMKISELDPRDSFVLRPGEGEPPVRRGSAPSWEGVGRPAASPP